MGSIETRANLPPMSKRACGDREGATGHAVGRFSVATYRTPLTIFNPEPHFCHADSARKIFQRNINCVDARAARPRASALRLAYCWSHGRREVIKAIPEAGSPVGDEILQRIAGLYVIEKQIRGISPEQRRAVRQQRAKPLVAELEAFIRAQRERLSSKSNMGQALAYLANHWQGLCLYLDDGRVEMDFNPVENSSGLWL